MEIIQYLRENAQYNPQDYKAVAGATSRARQFTIQRADGFLRRNQLGPCERKVRPISTKVKFINRVAGRIQIL